jgi:crotonobetainyl-CoA:carnitine CoA-transferase CaiB-like acyl-CoA transferase
MSAGALEGVTVVELSALAPTRFCTSLLKDLGARVIAVSAPGRASFHPNLDRGKESLVLDLKQPRGREIFLRLISASHVLVTGLAPLALERLGVSYATLSGTNAALVFCAMSAFGFNGPYRNRPAHDLNIVGLAGMLDLSFDRDDRPLLQSRLVSDFGGAALFATIGVLAALREAEQSGVGQEVDIAYLDSAFALLANTPQYRARIGGQNLPARAPGLAAGEFAYYAIYPTADARWISVACLEDDHWTRLCELVGRPDLKALSHRPSDHLRDAPPEHHTARRALSEVFRTKTADEWDASFKITNVCAAKVNTMGEAFADPQLRARGMLIESGKHTVVNSPVRLSKAKPRLTNEAPVAGEHSVSILASLGYGTSEIELLTTAGVVGYSDGEKGH